MAARPEIEGRTQEELLAENVRLRAQLRVQQQVEAPVAGESTNGGRAGDGAGRRKRVVR
jgi:hypothetical protein